MSYIKQVIHVDNYNQLPARGAEGVMYIVHNSSLADTYKIVKGFYWQSGSQQYKEIVDRSMMVHAPYTSKHPSRSSLNTIFKALEFLLNPGLGVIFNVTPDYVYGNSQHEVTFNWSVTKPVTEIASIVLKYANTDGIIDPNLLSVTVGTTGQTKKQLQILQNTEFVIQVTDVDGNIATASDIVMYSVNAISINSFTVTPTTFNQTPENIIPSLTLEWELSNDVEFATTLVLERRVGNGNWEYIDDLKDETVGMSGTSTYTDVSITNDVVYRLTVTSDGQPDVKESAVDYIPYQNVAFINNLTVSPDSGNFILSGYTFNARINKTTVDRVELYEVTSGGDIIPKAESIIGAQMAEGVNYVDITNGFSNQQINKEIFMQLPKHCFFMIRVYHSDEYGMSSFVQSNSVQLTYVSSIQFSSMTVTPTKGYPRTISLITTAVMSEAPLTYIDYISMMYTTGSLTPSTLYTFVGATALAKFTGTQFSHTESATIFNNSTTYTFHLRYKEAGMSSFISSQERTVEIQPELQIEVLSITGDEYSVLARINKTIAQASGNTYTITESLDGVTYTSVSGVVSGASNGKRTFAFNSSLTPSGGGDYYLKIVENLGASGANATSEDVESTVYTSTPKAYWGVITEGMLNAYQYSFTTSYSIPMNMLAFGTSLLELQGDYTAHLAFEKPIEFYDSSWNIYATRNVQSFSYNALTQTTIVVYSGGNVSVIPSFILFTSNYTLNTAITKAVLEPTESGTILTNSYLTSPDRILNITNTSPISLDFQTEFQEYLYANRVLGVGNAHQWFMVPDTYPEYNQYKQSVGNWTTLTDYYWIYNVTIGGTGYRLYIYRGENTEAGGQFLGGIPATVYHEFRLNN